MRPQSWEVTVSGPWVERMAWAGHPSDIGSARHFVSLSLREHGLADFESPMCLVASELCTNAVLHARTAFTVSVERRADLLLLEVIDGDETSPAFVAHGALDVNGRGLQIVDTLSSSWGVWPRQVGKSVWASFSLA